MKKLIIFIILYTSFIPFYAENINQEELKKAIAFSTVEANQNMARLVLNGKIEYLNQKYALDYISLAVLNKEELRLLRNAIFARYGYIFKSPELGKYFSQFSWYKPEYKNVDSLLTDVDKANIEMIKSFEQMNMKTRKIVNEKDITGLWHISLIMPSGFASVFQLYPDGRFNFRYSTMRELPIIISFSGKYTIKGNVLIFTSEKRKIIYHSSDVSFSGAFGYQWKSEKVVEEKQNTVYYFPVTKIYILSQLFDRYPESMANREVLKIGNVHFFKYSANPDDY